MKTPENISKENPFKVPDGYFESLTERTMEALNEGARPVIQPDMKPARRIHLKPFIALAASIIGFALITSVIVRVISPSDNNRTKNTEAGIFSDVMAEDIDIAMIEDALALSDVEIIQEEIIPAETIIEYLLLDNIEITDIYEFL